MRHGTLTAYNSYGCRCEECRAAKADAMREYRSRPEVREHLREYRQRPEVREHLREYKREYHMSRGVMPGFHSNAELDELLTHDHLGTAVNYESC